MAKRKHPFFADLDQLELEASNNAPSRPRTELAISRTERDPLGLETQPSRSSPNPSFSSVLNTPRPFPPDENPTPYGNNSGIDPPDYDPAFPSGGYNPTNPGYIPSKREFLAPPPLNPITTHPSSSPPRSEVPSPTPSYNPNFDHEVQVILDKNMDPLFNNVVDCGNAPNSGKFYVPSKDIFLYRLLLPTNVDPQQKLVSGPYCLHLCPISIQAIIKSGVFASCKLMGCPHFHRPTLLMVTSEKDTRMFLDEQAHSAKTSIYLLSHACPTDAQPGISSRLCPTHYLPHPEIDKDAFPPNIIYGILVPTPADAEGRKKAHYKEAENCEYDPKLPLVTAQLRSTTGIS